MLVANLSKKERLLLELANEGQREQDVDKIHSLERSLAKARAALKTEKKKLAAIVKQNEEQSSLLELVSNTKEKTRKAKPVRRSGKKGGKPKGSVLIGATDWHSEEYIPPSEANGYNEYTLDICKQRTDRLWDKSMYLTEFASNVADIEELWLWLGGDLIHGYIHEENIELNQLGPTEAILFVQDRISEGIETILKNKALKKVNVFTNFGNHGRATPDRRVSTAWRTSWEWLAYGNLQRLYASNPRVNFFVTQDYFNTVDIQGYRVRGHHGDNVSGGGSTHLANGVSKSIQAWNRNFKADYDIFGHYHTYVQDWNWQSSGCLCGHNDFAVKIKVPVQPPTQIFQLFRPVDFQAMVLSFVV